MYLQADILEWVRTFNVNQLKHFITIKNPQGIHYIQRILTHKPEYKPIDRITHGYSENKVQNEKCIYFREKYRYKNKKEEKMAMDKIFLENITVSRLNPWAFSVKKEFIKSESLRKCMLLFSDGQVFNYMDVKQMHVKLGSDKMPRSIWFDPTHIRSFSEWLIYLFEMEIFESYTTLKQKKYSLLSEYNYFTFVEGNITQESIKKSLENILVLYSQKKFRGKYAKKTAKKQTQFGNEQQQEDQANLQVTVEEAPFILSRCLDKFQDKYRDRDEILFQYEWYSEDRKSKVNRILKEVCRMVMRKFKDFQIDAKAKEIEELGQKKKKKKGKKLKDQKEQDQTEKLQEKIEQISNQSEQNLKTNIKIEPKEQNQPKIEQIKNDSSIIGQNEVKQKQNLDVEDKKQLNESKVSSKQQKSKEKEKGKKNGKNKPKPKHKKQQSLQKIEAAEKEQQLQKWKQLSIDCQKEQAKKVRKVVKQRINQHILFYYQQLCLSSQAVDKYRKICIETIEAAIVEMNLKVKWQLLLFGSYSVEFALRQSDLDIVMVVDDPQACSLNVLYEHFKVQEWLRRCNIVQIQSAKVHILQFQILLSCLKHPKLKDNKRLRDVIHVDISMTHRKESHEGIRNTGIMKEIFTEFPNLKIVSLVFKELLRIYQLNKPFRGGIGSYVLVILVHNIVKMQSEDYFHQLLEVCSFMTDHFEPYKTLISPYKDAVLMANPKLQLNIEDPRDNVLLNTTKMRQINEIIHLFNQLKQLLLEIETELCEVSVQERKKMKRMFFERWNMVFKPDQYFQER